MPSTDAAPPGSTPGVDGLVEDAAARAGGRPALVEPGVGTATWADVEERVASTAGALRDLGIGAGDAVAVMLPSSTAFAVAAWGVQRAGGVLVPVNPAYTPPEVAHQLGDSAARLVLTDAERAATATAATGLAGGAARVVVTGPEGLRGRGIAAGAAQRPDVAVLCYTSGTTGRPKGARLTADNLLSNLDSIAALPRLQLHDDDVLLGVLPFFHVFGLNVVLGAAARHGAAVLALDRFTPAGCAGAMLEHRVTVAYGAPGVFAALTAAAPQEGFPALRAAVSGADALPPSVWRRFRERVGVEIVEGYGLTETAPVLSSTAASPAVRPGTVGHPVPGVALRLLDPAGAQVGAGEVGEIWARGPNVFAGYHGQPAATAEVFRDGWFATGDLGRYDDGYLVIAGRLKDLVIVSGFNVYPREIEDVLLSHPDVAEAAVVGVPDDRTGERVRAVVVLRAGADLDADGLSRYCRERLARYKLPREVQLVPALPRLPTGKVARRALREPLR